MVFVKTYKAFSPFINYPL